MVRPSRGIEQLLNVCSRGTQGMMPDAFDAPGGEIRRCLIGQGSVDAGQVRGR